jgi:hypothetical protein|tara:strand:+ start:121 stop:357 length:237 start_codon:yes stop_codon:yes gene_type:complete
MTKNLNTIIQKIFIEKQIDKLKEVQKSIQKLLGENFIKKHIKEIYKQNNKIVVQTKTIEAKTELNIVKKKLKTQTTLL